MHLDRDLAVTRIRKSAARAMTRRDEIEPYTGLRPPYELEIRFYDRLTAGGLEWLPEDAVDRVEDFTIRIEDDVDLGDPPTAFRRAL